MDRASQIITELGYESENKMAFDPTKHLTKIQGRDYLPVNMRLVWFREDHPEGSVTTEIVNTEPIVIKATVALNGNILATGFGTPKTKGVASNRPFEGAETAAIGRALAVAGYGTQFTGEDEGEHLSDSPVENEPKRAVERPLDAKTVVSYLAKKAATYEKHGKTASDKQRKLFPMVFAPCFKSDADRYAVTKYLFGVASSKDLKDFELLAMLDWLTLQEEGDGYVPSAEALEEVQCVLRAAMKEQGQKELL